MVGYRPGLDVSSLGENEAVALCRISDSSGIDDIVQFPGGFSVDLYVLSLSAGYCSRTDLLQRNWILTDSFLLIRRTRLCELRLDRAMFASQSTGFASILVFDMG